MPCTRPMRVGCGPVGGGNPVVVNDLDAAYHSIIIARVRLPMRAQELWEGQAFAMRIA